MEDTLLGIGGLVGSVLFLILVVLGILLPVSAYSAQKYARKCFKELQYLHGQLDGIQQTAAQQLELLDKIEKLTRVQVKRGTPEEARVEEEPEGLEL